MKEYRAYVLDASVAGEKIYNISGYLIDNWGEYKKLPKEALLFIQMCEEQGTVYSLKGLMTAINITEDVGNNDYVFITNLY